MSPLFRFVFLCSLPFLFLACGEDVNPNYPEEVAAPEFYHRAVKQLTDVIVHDIFSPPVAARIYSYSNIAGYEALAAGDPSMPSLAGQIPHLSPVPAPPAGVEISHPIAALAAQLKTGKSMIFSEEKMEVFEDTLFQEIAAIGVPEDVMAASLAYGRQVADHIIEWYGGDNYKQTRTFPKYSISNDVSKWQPTPPDYMDGIEPSWMKIRTFALDSASQFRPLPPTPYSESKDSKWYQEVMEVYEAMRTTDTTELAERINIAKFWDCNPYVSHHIGHVMFATKKITPGGHWINITAIAARQAKADLATTTRAYATVSMALHDGFISCWDEKYRSRLLRPETFINRHIDEEWRPLLQTPPFPEHTSGHSVISRASATVLTHIFGDNFAFTDDSEVEFDLPARDFPSFLAASEEAALSRLYGGIHYRPAIDYGMVQGEAVGKHLLERIQLGSTTISKK
ncbi:vanadium-dependent haloperoxidase [Neolewinella lacunae]|uniref:Vanadium-dependent haloperoxidase n=1 Tax=Neolewinella lacunae TaxID=1517758 RepID=A0A923PKV2_9BACT|nr:vanadium-dependent haloperoxidase [Neolewinella lacunae]MBC6993541.1 vanadium-dependent haloperoxidase [Neolewinella lacunae]MDN3636183.1 vanadium-dependent haloperoxidase [Neolewinella lacunae]